jgi:hypothetical protein
MDFLIMTRIWINLEGLDMVRLWRIEPVRKSRAVNPDRFTCLSPEPAVGSNLIPP